jgi:hypothetical protein
MRPHPAPQKCVAPAGHRGIHPLSFQAFKNKFLIEVVVRWFRVLPEALLRT